jgi:Cysteine-rich secretory protein family
MEKQWGRRATGGDVTAKHHDSRADAAGDAGGCGMANPLFLEPAWRLFRHICVSGIRGTSRAAAQCASSTDAFRAKYGLSPLVLDARLSRAAAMQSKDQAGRSWIGHYWSDGSRPRDRAARAGYRPKIAAENVASGQKSFSDVLRGWEGSSGHRSNLLLPNVSGAGVAMAQNESGRAYWTLVLGAE